MSVETSVKTLCTPAKIYLGMSTILFIITFFQNLRNPNSYTVGTITVPIQHHNFIFFLIKALYIIFWTWLLNKFCRWGYRGLSWFLVIMPIIGFFVLTGILLVVGAKDISKLL